jgi:hypothetical protein
MMARTSEIRFAGKPKQKRVAEELGALQQPGTSMVLVKAIKGGSDLLYDSFYLFHRTLRFPVTKLTTDWRLSAHHGARIDDCRSNDAAKCGED